ncbi:hypothetical protein PMIN04_007459 [Paraphaeosphaeria minitans]
MFAFVERLGSSLTAFNRYRIVPSLSDRPDISKVSGLGESLERRESNSSPQNKFHRHVLKLHSDSSRQSSSSSDFQLHQVALNQPIARAPAAVVPSARPQ